MVFITYIVLFNLLSFVIVSNAQPCSNGICTRCPKGQYLDASGCTDCSEFESTVTDGIVSPSHCRSMADVMCMEEERDNAVVEECSFYHNRVVDIDRGFISPHRKCMEEALFSRCLMKASAARCGIDLDVTHVYSVQANCSAIHTDILDCYDSEVTAYTLVCERKVTYHYDRISTPPSAHPLFDVQCPLIKNHEKCMKDFLDEHCSSDLTALAAAQMAEITKTVQCDAAPESCGAGYYLDANKQCSICPANTSQPYIHNLECIPCDLAVPPGSQFCLVRSNPTCASRALNVQITVCFDDFQNTLDNIPKDTFLYCLETIDRCDGITNQQIMAYSNSVLNDPFCHSHHIHAEDLIKSPALTCYDQVKAETSFCKRTQTRNINQASLNGEAACPYVFNYGACINAEMNCYSQINNYTDTAFLAECPDPTTNTLFCQEGNYFDLQTQTCKPCPAGTYNSLPHVIQCKPCPQGSDPNAEATQCIAASQCPTELCTGTGVVCVNTPSSYRCVCGPGYQDISITETPNCRVVHCASNPCGANVQCIEQLHGYICDCTLGAWDGSICTEDECYISSPCDTNADCTDTINAPPECECRPGWAGDGFSCTDIDECALGTDTCLALQECTNLPGSYECYDCDLDDQLVNGVCVDDKCDPNPCLNGGTCGFDGASFVCSCVIGFDGNNCQDTINECSSNPCQNGGSCTDGIHSYSCQCISGYTGEQCQGNIDDCSSNPCQNGGSCIDEINSYSCQCIAGYAGDQCQDIDECSERTDNCDSVKENCIDKDGTFECECKRGYVENANGDCVADGNNECEINPSVCDEDRLCVNTLNGFICDCLEGYEKTTQNGVQLCTNIDECTKGLDDCSSLKVCVDNAGSFTCPCKAGYMMQAVGTCIDRDECDRNPCDIDKEICVNTEGSFNCQCNTGFTGSPCTDILECQGAHDCAVQHTCKEVPGSYICECDDGKTQVGDDCVNINECDLELHNCKSTEKCVDTETAFTCACGSGYFGDPCKDIDECLGSNIALLCDPGNCVNLPGSYACTCPFGFASVESNTRCERISELFLQLRLAVNYQTNILSSVETRLTDATSDILGNLLQSPQQFALSPGSIIAKMTMGVINPDLAVDKLQEVISTGFYAGYQIDTNSVIINVDNQKGTCVNGHTISASGSCIPCPHGTYKTDFGLQDCTLCAIGLNTTAKGATIESQCVTNCEPGTYWQATSGKTRGECRQCPLDTYTETFLSTSCKECGSHYSTLLTRSSSRFDCINVCIANSNYCANGGTCIFDDVNKEPKCKCQLGFGGDECGNTVTVITAIDPAYGPKSGGTVITIYGLNFKGTLNPEPYIGESPCAVMETSTDNQIVCQTPALGNRNNQPFAINIIWSAIGKSALTAYTFEYRPDPFITDLFPLSSIVGGGVTLTVTGEFFTSVKYPMLNIRVLYAPTDLNLVFKHDCTVSNSGLMFCKTPALNLTDVQIDLLPPAEGTSDTNTAKRKRRQTTSTDIIVTAEIDLGGAASPDYPIIIHRNPEITRIEEPPDHRPFWPFYHKSFEIKGKGLAGAEHNEYIVGLGTGKCESLDVTDNLIVCYPPLDKPDIGSDGQEGKLAIQVFVGANVNSFAGYLNFESSLWEYKPARIGILAGIAGIVVIIGLIILCHICGPRLFPGNRTVSEQFSIYGLRRDRRYQAKAGKPRRPSPERHGTVSNNSFITRMHSDTLSGRSSMYSSHTGSRFPDEFA